MKHKLSRKSAMVCDIITTAIILLFKDEADLSHTSDVERVVDHRLLVVVLAHLDY